MNAEQRPGIEHVAAPDPAEPLECVPAAADALDVDPGRVASRSRAGSGVPARNVEIQLDVEIAVLSVSPDAASFARSVSTCVHPRGLWLPPDRRPRRLV